MDFSVEIIQNISTFVGQTISTILTASAGSAELLVENFSTILPTFLLVAILLLFLTIRLTKSQRNYEPNPRNFIKPASPTNFTRPASRIILAILIIAFFSYDLPEKYQLANLGVGARFIAPNATDTNQTGDYQGLMNQTPTTILGETTQENLSLLEESHPSLYQLLNPNSTHHAPLQLGSFILTSKDKFIFVPGSIETDFLKRRTIESANLATGSITSRTIEDKTIQKEDLSSSLKEQIYDTDSSAGVVEETDPVFIAWNKQTGITIQESQISDLQNYLTSYTETDPNISAWAKALTKPTYTATEIGLGNVPNLTFSGSNTGDNATNSLYSGLATSKQDALNGTGFVKISGTAITYDNSTYVTGTPWASMGYLTSYTETDPVYSAWNKSTGISITESQISNLRSYLTSYTETDGTFTSWYNSSSPSLTTLTLSQAIGTAPMQITSTTKVANLNADLLDGFDSSAFGDATAANQTEILTRIGTNADAASMTGSIFAALRYIMENMNNTKMKYVGNTTCNSSAEDLMGYSTDFRFVVCKNGVWEELGTAADESPDPYNFIDQTELGTNVLTYSDIVQISGIDTAILASVVSDNGTPEFRVCANSDCSSIVTDWSSIASYISNTQYIQLRMTTAPTGGNVTYVIDTTLGAVTANWRITTTIYTLATGGTITTSGDYKIHTFTSDGTFNVTVAGAAEALVVGGGGGGGGAFTGGGGGGGIVYLSSLSLNSGNHAVVVGAGGTGGLGWSNGTAMAGGVGDDSSLDSYIAKGGGGGSAAGTSAPTQGGCGGGGGGYQFQAQMTGAVSSQQTYAEATIYGTSGGNGCSVTWGGCTGYNGGGGGGAGGAGVNGATSAPGNGGPGQTFSISGSSVAYAGGGGGSSQGTGYGLGGVGGGGNGTATNAQAQSGTNGLGGGGGAGGYDSSSNSRIGGNGGSGIVIIKHRYR
jgi:hypothetical protein